jgi:diguanylate cyclase (GGDEF)-like protein
MIRSGTPVVNNDNHAAGAGFFGARIAQRVASLVAGRRLPDDVYGELVDMLSRGVSPILSMTVVVTAIGGSIYAMTGDLVVAAITLASFLLTLVRIAVNIAYHRRRALGPLPIADVKNWEIALGAGTVLAGVVVGLLNARALMAEQVAVHLLVAALTFGFSAGAVVRLSVRPLIAALTLFPMTALTFAGFVTHAQTADGDLALAYGGQALLLGGFAIGAIEMVNQLYKSTLDQLMTKAELSRLARRDALTGLPNRIALREHFDREVLTLRQSGELIALHFLDLDRFKAVNDNHGHLTGDALLQAVAARLNRVLRAGDTAARLGGDEFVVVQTQVRDPGEAEMLARRIVKEISAPYRIGDAEVHIGASVGVALAPLDGTDLDELAARGDAALYRSKNRRGTVSFWRAPEASGQGAA